MLLKSKSWTKFYIDYLKDNSINTLGTKEYKYIEEIDKILNIVE
jgi:hypothetical protein